VREKRREMSAWSRKVRVARGEKNAARGEKNAARGEKFVSSRKVTDL